MRKTRIVIFLAAVAGILLLFASCGILEEKETRETVNLLFFHNNTCESCNEDEKFTQIVRDKLLAHKEEYPYEYQIINVFKTEGLEKYQETLKMLGVHEGEASFPLMVVGNSYVSGYDQISEKISLVVREEALGGSTADRGDSSSRQASDSEGFLTAGETLELNEIRLFTTFSCTECEKVKNKISETEMPVVITEYNISQGENARLMLESFQAFGVPDQEQQVPILFWNGTYASGSQAIRKVLDSEEWWLEKATVLSPGESTGALQEALTWKDFLKIAGAGLLNGFNPCALSMLFFLLSLLSGTEGKIGKLGGSYLLGKFLAYLFMGVGMITILASAEDLMVGSYTVMKFILLGAAVFLAVMNFMDFLHVVKKEYGKVRMQLPASLRKWNQKMIQRFGSRGGRGLVLIIFLLGMVISAGEFFCTGQIYAATLLMLFRTGSGIRLLVLLAIVCYVTALCIPSAVCLIVVAKGKSVLTASDKALKYMPLIKLANGILFLLFAIFFAFS